MGLSLSLCPIEKATLVTRPTLTIYRIDNGTIKLNTSGYDANVNPFRRKDTSVDQVGSKHV
jgi:hypothetical protein